MLSICVQYTPFVDLVALLSFLGIPSDMQALLSVPLMLLFVSLTQMKRAGLDKSIGDLVEIVYVNAPHPASGPIPNDVTPVFKGPYFEWWNAIQVGFKCSNAANLELFFQSRMLPDVCDMFMCPTGSGHAQMAVLRLGTDPIIHN